jgi:arsenate reductase
MAEGWTRQILGDRVEAQSAGISPGIVNPLAIKVMKEVDIDISSQRSKSVDEFNGEQFDLIITLCDNVNAQCPFFPGNAKRIHIPFPDPALASGPEEEVIKVYREVRDGIRNKIIPLIEEEWSRSGKG